MKYDDPRLMRRYNKLRRKLFTELCLRAWDDKTTCLTEKIGVIAMGIAATHEETVERLAESQEREGP
jgi:hypothetical protein